MKTINDRHAEHLEKREEYMRDATAEKLGKIISKMRNKENFTQKEFAEKIGLSQPQLSAIESGRQIPTYPTMLKMSKVLNQDPMVFWMRLMVEGMVVSDVSQGMLEEEDFKKLTRNLTKQIEELCIQKVQNSYASNVSSFGSKDED